MQDRLKKARDFVYANGFLWERALFGTLFEGRPAAQLLKCLAAYKNEDGGFGHGLEPDIRCPDSHPLALEFLLKVLYITGIPFGDLLEGTPDWLLRQRKTDGSLVNPPGLLDYPHAFWWNEGGQMAPDSITGLLLRLGICPEPLRESTARWASRHLTSGTIEANDWLFMGYHAFDYYMHSGEADAALRNAAIDNVVRCALKAPERQLYVLFNFATEPAEWTGRFPSGFMDRCLDVLEGGQREDGGWEDEHGLPQWRSFVTITALLALRNYGRLTV